MVQFVIKAWVLFCLFQISMEDIRSYTIPNIYTAAILAASPLLCTVPIHLRVLAAVFPAVLIPLMGMGDVKLYGALGFVLGPFTLLQIACISMLTGGIYAAALLIFRRAGKKDRIAFGPFIAGAAAFVMICPSGLSVLFACVP